MHLTLHLTSRCNMRCTYCYEAEDGYAQKDMPLETALAAIHQQESAHNIGVIFFGGEPLLRKDLIADIIEQTLGTDTQAYHYKVTTNGLLLDEEFFDFSDRTGLQIALSHDGQATSHDRYRHAAAGGGTFAALQPKLELLLARRPYAPVLLVVNPDTASAYYNNVRWLHEQGVKYVIASLNHHAPWTDADLFVLRQQYEKLYDWIFALYRAEDRFYFSPLEKIIGERILGGDYGCCQAGIRQISVAPDGTFYPCVQFVGRREYAIGNAFAGLDTVRRDALYQQNLSMPKECAGCALHGRCHNRCACLNLQCTGDLTRPPAILCEYERMLFPLADRLAAQLYDEKNPLFLRRHTDRLYPVQSFLEDLAH